MVRPVNDWPPPPEPEKPALIDVLRRRLVHHEAKAGQLRDMIATLEANPTFEKFYNLVQKCKS